MKNIELIKNLELDPKTLPAKDLEVDHLYDGSFGKIVEIRLQNGAVLSRHKADEPITVMCVSGRGVFRAGSDLEDSLEMRAGTLITLEAGVEHEAAANPALHLIVTKFKNI